MKKLSCAIVLVGFIGLWSKGPAFAAGLTRAQAEAIFDACQATAAATTSALRQPVPQPTKMWCAVVDREGELLLIRSTDTEEEPGPKLSSDAWRGSIEIAIAKAYTAVAFSSSQQKLDSAEIGAAAQPGAPLFGIGDTNPYRPAVGAPSLHPDDSRNLKHHGIVTFGGGEPVYRCGTDDLLGAVGVSGDGVPQDIAVAEGAVTGAGFCLTP
jgi:uncharacterized protein GlcG (DUF336 family)